MTTLSESLLHDLLVLDMDTDVRSAMREIISRYEDPVKPENLQLDLHVQRPSSKELIIQLRLTVFNQNVHVLRSVTHSIKP